MMREPESQAGFTMIEVMVSVLITAIAALGFIAMYMTETQAGRFTRHSTEASVLATDKLEELRGINTPTSGNDTAEPQGYNASGMFTRKWTATTATNYITIVVQVGWNEDETTATCSVDSACTTSKFCMPSGSCAGRAVTVYGRRDLP